MRALTILLLLLFSKSLFTQTYQPFLQDNHRWMVSWDLDNTLWDFDYFYENVFGADTLINDTTYTMVWLNYYARTGETGGFETIVQPFEPGFQDELVGFVREDTMLQRVYFRSEDAWINDREFLLYDFNLEVGDIVFDSLVGAGPYQVEQVNSEFSHGASRRVWSLDGGQTITEGIGSNFGPFEGITNLISGGYVELYQFCNRPAMDCHVAVDGLVNNRRQITLRYLIPSSGGPWETAIVSYRFQDTVHFNGEVFWELSGPSIGNPGEGIYYRQVGSKVYRYHPTYDDEVKLLFDFELPMNLSYTFESNYPMNFSEQYYHIGSSPFVLDNGEERNSLLLFNLEPQAPWQENVQWVEGIGDIRNPLFPEEYLSPYFDIVTSELLCFYDDYEEEPIYRNPLYENCSGDIIDQTEEASLQAIELYPNPTSGLVYVKSPAEGLQIVLFDLFGRQLITQATTQAIDLTNSPSGTYFYHILDQKGVKIDSGKLLKQ